VELTYYNKSFKDMLFNASVAPDLNNGFTRFVRNIATMYNRGFEFNVSAAVIKKEDFNWNIGVTGATLDNKITKLNEPVSFEFGGLLNIAQLRPDNPIGGFYVGATTSAPATRTFAGTALPKFEGNMNTSFNYKNLSLVAVVGGKGGFYRFNSTEFDLANSNVRFHKELWNLPKDQLDAYVNNLANWVQKADFMKLRQLGLTYLYTPKMQTVIKTMSISLIGSNLITWSKYKGGYDVEAETSGSGSPNAWVRGIDAWEAGMPKQWTVSFNIGF
jgi:hypothetical protein